MHDEQVKLAINEWLEVRQTIEHAYAIRSLDSARLLEEQLLNFRKTIEQYGTSYNHQLRKEQFILAPLNYEERISFVEAKKTSHYAFVQLDALFDEMRKKFARVTIARKL